jgi:hypothetical protein
MKEFAADPETAVHPQTVIEHFGSWNAAQRAAGLVPRRFATREELVTLLRRLGDELGRTPTARDLDAHRGRMPSKSLYWLGRLPRFADWADARRADTEMLTEWQVYRMFDSRRGAWATFQFLVRGRLLEDGVDVRSDGTLGPRRRLDGVSQGAEAPALPAPEREP